MNNIQKSPQNIFLYDRERMELCGIDDVESFNDTGVVMICSGGGICVEGESLKIETFSADSGKLTITGKVTGFYYYDRNVQTKQGFLSRFMK